MLSKTIALSGTLPKVKAEDARRLSVYVVRGSTIVASAPADEDGKFRVALPRSEAAKESAYALEVVVAPTGMRKSVEHLPGLQRVRLNRQDLAKAEADVAVSTKDVSLSKETLAIWWRWCYQYCVSGTVVGPDGCPVPGADVTVYNVGFGFPGYTKTPETTVTADENGFFTACFTWCTCPICLLCWPCFPIWWECFPWWWELDILHVIETLEKVPIGPVGPGPVERLQSVATLMRPEAKELIRGQGFAAARKADAVFGPDVNRTALIKRKLSNPAIRAIFPFWWWCCNLPNIVFSATQGPRVIVDENPATDTRWCLPNHSSVTLVANNLAISHCPGDPPPAEGFAWTRVGNITVDKIHQGYADGAAGTDTSELAFAGTLDIYGGFAGSAGVSYYQVDAGQWTGDPARGGVAPGGSTPLTADLYNYVFIYDAAFNLTFAGPIKMGPFSNAGLNNLYATQEARQGAPVLPAFPPVPGGGHVLWAFEGLKVSTNSSNLIGLASTGAVDLTMTGYDGAFNPVGLLGNAPLTLTIDNLPLTNVTLNPLGAYRSDGSAATLTGTGDCPAYDIGAGGFVTVDAIVSDSNGHVWAYEVDAEWGHGHTAAVTPTRGYSQSPATFTAGVAGTPGLPGTLGAYQAPNTAQKSFGGGEDYLRFYPTVDCCYEFRIRAGKRVTNGYVYPTLADYDFRTISLKVS